MENPDVKRVERVFAPFYPAAALAGVLLFVAALLFNDGWGRLSALIWVVLVPLWIWRYKVYFQSRRHRD